jgi:hypothetical protein
MSRAAGFHAIQRLQPERKSVHGIHPSYENKKRTRNGDLSLLLLDTLSDRAYI